MRKRLLLAILSAVLAMIPTGCTQAPNVEVPTSQETETERIQIVATLFPQYDFARQIAGDKAEVRLLLPPGIESHSYEPTPSDMVKISESDLFIYTGRYMEAWSHKIIESMKDSGSKSMVLDVSRGIELVRAEDGHRHEDEDDDGHEPERKHLYDPHIWTDPMNAKAMVNNISEALSAIDPANEEYYESNASEYCGKLDSLDKEFRAVVSAGRRDEIVFGSRFALFYFVKRYGLDYEAAFDSCSSETEPSTRTMAGLIKEIREEKIPVIYYAEIEEPKVAKFLSKETGAKMLLLHSCHNLTREELNSGATYLSLMKQNLENLKEGLE